MHSTSLPMPSADLSYRPPQSELGKAFELSRPEREFHSDPTSPPRKPRRIERERERERERPYLELPTLPTMASAWCLSAPAAAPPEPGALGASASATGGAPALARAVVPVGRRCRWGALVVRAAPDEEKITRRSPLDFPIVILLLFPPFTVLSLVVCGLSSRDWRGSGGWGNFRLVQLSKCGIREI